MTKITEYLTKDRLIVKSDDSEINLKYEYSGLLNSRDFVNYWADNIKNVRSKINSFWFYIFSVFRYMWPDITKFKLIFLTSVMSCLNKNFKKIHLHIIQIHIHSTYTFKYILFFLKFLIYKLSKNLFFRDLLCFKLIWQELEMRCL